MENIIDELLKKSSILDISARITHLWCILRIKLIYGSYLTTLSRMIRIMRCVVMQDA